MTIKQRGNGFGLYIVFLFFRFFGYIGLRFVLWFVVFYFALTTPTLKRHLRTYYNLCTGEFNFRIYYRHLYTFALVFADRFLSKRFLSRYSVTPHNTNVLTPGQAHLYLFSHVGDWTMCGLVTAKKNVPINIVMKEVIKESIQDFSKSIEDPTLPTINVIDLNQGAINTAVRIAKALQSHEIVAMMTDRLLHPEGGVSVTFLGRTIQINKNPFEVAYNRHVPIIALFSLRTRDYKYNVYYHRLDPFDFTLPKTEAIALAAQKYTDLLEKTVRNYPDQWFNHYDFFGDDA